MRNRTKALVLGLAALAFVAHVVAQTAPDKLTLYCNQKRGHLDAGMVKKQCKCSLKRALNPAYDVNTCLNAIPQGVVTKFLANVGAVYVKVRTMFVTYPTPACQDEAGFSSTALDAAGRTVVACCQTLSQYMSCVQQGAF